MRFPCLVLVSLALLAEVYPAEDIYWEGDDVSNEFLEVEPEDTSITRHLQRLKRDLFDSWNLFGSSSTTTEAPEDVRSNFASWGDSEGPEEDEGKEDGEYDLGSGSPDKEPEKEKTLHVTFVVIQPYQESYSNRDSPQFQNFSRSLASAVDSVFEKLPGTHRASLVRIQSRATDEFSCKVTLDIVTNGDTERIDKMLHEYIKQKRNLGGFRVNDEDYSSISDPSGPLSSCSQDQIRCSDGRCQPATALCNGVNDCSDGGDEMNCPFENNDGDDQTYNQSESEDYTTEGSEPCEELCKEYKISINCSQRCDGIEDCPLGDDEENCEEATTREALPVPEATTREALPVPVECAFDELRCDDQRCVHISNRCNRIRDCDDGTDEEDCDFEPETTPAPIIPVIPSIEPETTPAPIIPVIPSIETCGENDFRCDNNKCIEEFRRCDRVVDCAHGEDEMNCECNADEFRCEDTGTCIEARKVCDKRNNCRDGSDERNCACSSNEWQCDHGSCIKRSKRCDGLVDCPTDRSDERNCVAEGYFRCRSGKLIPDYQRCNRRYDCDHGDYSDEQNCPCGEGDFKCDNGYCIPPSKRCDITHDCQDGSDERDCIYGTVCMAYQYKCSSGHCVPAESRCNGTAECVDHSDEKDCPCKRDEFKCRDGSCINLSKRCNGHKDCILGEDELNCDSASCRADEFACDPSSSTKCGVKCNGYQECDDGEDELNCDSDCNLSCDGKCLEDSRICDGNNDCSDGIDELDCSNCDGIHDFRCDDGECISANLVCNNLDDCRDGSDERDCGNTTTPSYGCNENQFQCASGACVDIQFRCDKHSDCVDNSDEENCPCDPSDWQCTSGECIREGEYCNGIPDCRDFSDEIDCPNTTPSPPYIPPYIPQYTPPPPTTRIPDVATVPPIFIPQTGENSLDLRTYPENQTIRYGGDIEFSCRDEGNLRAPVRWVRENGRPLKPGSIDRQGRLEMFKVTTADSGVYICQAPAYLGRPGSEVRVTLNVENAPVTSFSAFPSCLSHQATCGNGQCISKLAVCDGRPDCLDGSDEEACHSNGKCEPNQFKCNNGKCVLSTWVCDSENDCGDNSDEANCISNDPRERCKVTEYSCRSNDQCIPRSFHCDGQFDCIDRSDEVGCSPVTVIRPPSPPNVRLNPGENLTLECEATGIPTPLISWRLNWGHVPQKCRSTSENGIGKLYCPDMQFEDSGAYSCEAINNKGTAFANPDSIVFVKREERTCPSGYFNSEARSENECIRCFCFGKSTDCRSADLYTYNMPTPLGEGGTRLLGVSKTYQGDVQVDKNQQITEQFYYQPLRNGATVTKLALTGWSNIDRVSVHPYLTLPETYNGNQLKSYGGHIKYRLTPHSPQPSFGSNDGLPDIIIMGKYQNLSFTNRARDTRSRDIAVEARLTVGNWEKPSPRGTVPASREDIMMALDDIKMILLRADMNNGGVNITDFAMESGQYLNAGLGAASLVEECTCPEGYEGLSCQKCASGYERVMSGPWLGTCVARRECPPGTYGDPNNGGACRPCPCPLTNRENQFARTCALGSNGRVVCDCMPGYEGDDCSYCAPGYYGNPLFPGNSCKPKPSETCNPIGTVQVRPPDECVCKDNVQGRNCDQCKNGTYYLSNDFRHGCAQCFCAGVIQDCTTSNYRRVTTTVQFNVPQIVDQVRLYKTTLAGSFGTVRYNAPLELDLQPTLYRGEIALSGLDRSQPAIYYWSLPPSFSGNKVTSYGGYLNYQINHVPSTGLGNRNNAADVQLISLNGLTFHYFGNFAPTSDGFLNATVQFLEKGWQRSDGKPVTREYFLLALADVQTILIKATYTSNPQVSSIVSASIDTASPDGSGPQALHVEQCMCPEGYKGSSCEDCADGYTRTESGLYLEHCGRCDCNGHSSMCHPDTGECYNCADNTAGPNCEECVEGYERDRYNNCVPGRDQPPEPTCNCDPRGESRPCEYGYCSCKPNVEGQYCDRCRNGTFGLDASNPLGCIECYCSGATRNCHEASHYNRISMPAPIFGEDYGGYSLMNINADSVINDQFVPVPKQSELKYIFTFPPTQELYWSLPFPGNRVLSYGGSLSLTQMFETGGDIEESTPQTDVVLEGDEVSVYWSNPTPIRSGEAMSYQVPLSERGWYILNTVTPASRFDFMAVLKDIKRVLVRATLARNILSTSIADVWMDTADERYDQNLPAATGVEVCFCPEGYMGTSCESCSTGYYKDTSSACRQCPCNGHDCQLDSYNEVVCNCRPPYSGPDCSSYGNEATTTYRPNPPRGTVVVKISSPTIKIQEIGSTVNFTCQAQSRMTPRKLKVNWRKEDGKLPLDRTQFDDRIGAIIITNLQISDSGVYVCESYDGVSTEQATATLKVPAIEMTQPEVFVTPQIKDYYEGDRLELECISRGNPAPTISWQRGPSQALSNRFEVQGNTLIIENLLEEDAGEYNCIASNAAGSAGAIAVVNVRPRPSQPPREKLTVSSTSPSVNEGQNIRLVCTASPNVAAGTIEWVRQDGTPFLSNVYSDNGVLYVDKAYAQNQGVYMCQTASYDVSPVLVVLTVIPLRTPSPIEAANITLNKDHLEIPTGGSDTVDCIPEGNPIPLVKWSRSSSSDFGPGTSQRENTLIISNAQESDSGYYECEGIIDGKPVVRNYIYVNILRREVPQVEIYPQGEISIQLGSQYELTCLVNGGIPAPVVTWNRSGGRPLSPHVQIQPNNRLSFQNIEVNDEGDYTCTAANAAGSSSATATLKVRSGPEITITPSNHIPVAVGDKVEVECRADGYPEPEVSIKSMRDNHILVPSRTRIAKLSIPYVTDAHDDDYICTATSAAGTIEEQFAIRVERGDGGSIDNEEGSGEDFNPYPDEGDQIIGPNANNPSNMIAQEGKDAVITCNASSEYRVRWDRADRRPLQDNARQYNADLIIYNATKRDSGRYQCTLINQRTQEAQISAITSLIVLAAPRISLKPQTQTVRPGESTTVECVVEGDDIRSVFWSPIDSYPSRRVEFRNNTLVFRQIEVEDAGQYKCTAISGVAEAYAKAEVIVSEDTDRETESHDNEQYAGLGAVVHLSCNATQRGLTIYWKKDGYELPSSVIQRNDGSLYIRRAQKSDSGHYVCTLRDQYGRETNNYINLHIGNYCSERQFHCYDDSKCIEEDLVCDGNEDCMDSSDETLCSYRKKKRSWMHSHPKTNVSGDRVDSKLISIEKPEGPFRVGERVEILCRAVSRNVRAQWERYGTRQYVESRIYGDGALLIIPNVQESDAGVYRCNGEDRNVGRSYEDFNLEVIPGPNEPSYPASNDEDKVYTARQGDTVDLPCNHNLQGRITIEWKREYQPLPPHVRTNEDVIRLDHVTEADAGTYICKVSNDVARVTARATLRVIGVIPKFNGDGLLAMAALKDAYTKFDIEVSFKPLDGNGIILYNSENDDENGDYLVLQLVDGVPRLTLKLSRDYSDPVITTGDRPLQLNAWHTIRLSRSEYKVTMDVDNTGPFVAESSQSLGILDLHAPLYIGNGPEASKRPYELQQAPGFIGCVSMLILGKEEKNILAESLDQINVSDCDSCAPNLCLNKGVCQEARNERGYMCLCAPGFAGLNCDRTGEACRPGLCGPGKCKDTADGYKCSCPVTYTGKNCDIRQNIAYPAFTGSAYLAIEAPKTSRSLRMSMKIKAKPPVTDGIIMYCAQSDRGYGGFTALTVRNGRLEFRYDLGDGNPPIVLVSNRTLSSEWTDVHIARVGQLVSLKIDMMQNYEAKLSSPRDLHLGTPMFVGGVDGDIILNNNTGVSGGFSGCIKDVSLHGGQLDLIGATIQSANIQECGVNYDRGDIPEIESVCSQCRNSGYCTNPDASACTCQPGFTGTYCESRLPLSNIMRAPRDPCDASPCINGGTCKTERGTRLNYTCDCPLGFAGANCQMPLELLQSVGFNGNGYLELPMSYLRYDNINVEPVLVAMAFHTTSDGVLLYQTEATVRQGGDYLMLRIERGEVVMEWDMGSGPNSLSLPGRRVTDGERHDIIAKLYGDMRVELTVDGIPRSTINNGISNVMNADSNIYIGGIPEYRNVYNLPGLIGCIEQVEFNSDRSVNLGRTAITGRNTQPCKEALRTPDNNSPSLCDVSVVFVIIIILTML